MSTTTAHWDGVWRAQDADEVSWFQASPTTSLRLLEPSEGPVVDVGAGASRLADALLAQGREVTVLDVAARALETTRRRVESEQPDAVARLHVVVDDVLTWQPPAATFGAWHDRAVLHFLRQPAQQRAYAASASHAVRPGGVLVVGAFAPDGPDHCSGLPVARHDADDLAALFADSFTLERAERERHRTPSGGQQWFTWVRLRRLP